MSSIANAIVAAAQTAGIDPKIAIEVATRESGMNPAVSDGASGEIGIFQILPATGAGLGYSVAQLRDPNQNIVAGVTYLAQLLVKYGDPSVALAAYNWGPGNIDRTLSQYGSTWFSYIPSSTQSYVNTILANVQTQYAAAAGPVPVPIGLTNIFPPMTTAASAGMSLWTQIAIVVGVIFGAAMLLSE